MAEQIKVAPRPQDRGAFEEAVSGILESAEIGFTLFGVTGKFSVMKVEESHNDGMGYDLYEHYMRIGATNDPMTAAKFVVEGF